MMQTGLVGCPWSLFMTVTMVVVRLKTKGDNGEDVKDAKERGRRRRRKGR